MARAFAGVQPVSLVRFAQLLASTAAIPGAAATTSPVPAFPPSPPSASVRAQAGAGRGRPDTDEGVATPEASKRHEEAP